MLGMGTLLARNGNIQRKNLETSMVKTNALETVERYFELWSRKDYQASRTYLADDLHFEGPFDTFDRADDLIAALTRLGPVVREIRRRKIFAEGENVCVTYDMVIVNLAEPVRITEIFTVGTTEKITSISAFFDPRPFVSIFGSN